MTTIRAADLFCGAGGTSTGLAQACEELGLGRVQLTAVNHWPVAIESHAANHPWANHLCESLDTIDPRKVTGGKLDVLLASPECTHHSIARGGRPMSDQSRSTAWHVLRWAEALRPRCVIVENVREWQTWGPLGANGRPLKRRRGETFVAWVQALVSLGYRVEHRVLQAADYGDPTTRQRLFVVATRGRAGVRWPTPSHAQDPGLFAGEIERWRPARDIIDWDLAGRSIFGRTRPLAEKTIERIAAGMRRFGWPEPFLVMLYGTGTARTLDLPLPTVTAKGGHLGLVEPFILPHRQFKEMTVDSLDDPLRTVTANNGGGALVRPFLAPFFGERAGQEPRTHDIDEPAPAVTSHGAGGVCRPFLVKYNGRGGRRAWEDEA